MTAPFLANLTQQTNGNLVQAFVLTPWADLYNFSVGGFRAMLRGALDDPYALFEWSTAKGNIVYSQTLANGSIAFTVNPSPGDRVTLGSSTFTWSSANVGINLAASLSTLKAFCNASVDSQISKCTYDVVGGTDFLITFKTAGTLGNAFDIGSNSTGTTASGTTLTGGGGLLTLTASVADIETFNGTYVYDVRYENGATLAPLFGGTIEFTMGATRDATA